MFPQSLIRPQCFKFDHVFGAADDQEAVFAESLPVVRSVMDGFNVCIFAYGQTGTGKTFTMEGVPENRGVNYRALEELFRISEERSSSVAYTFCVSILEVYNEKIRDLLDDNSGQTSKRLDIKQSADGAQEVPGLVEAPICTIDGVWEKLKAGARNRSVGSTSVNELSSRSHSLVRVTVTSEHLVTGQRSRSHMSLVDLAGSDRLAKTEVEGERLKEAKFINKSLSALGDVIAALASKNTHIPYRNSKLTHLLQSSLGWRLQDTYVYADKSKLCRFGRNSLLAWPDFFAWVLRVPPSSATHAPSLQAPALSLEPAAAAALSPENRPTQLCTSDLADAALQSAPYGIFY